MAFAKLSKLVRGLTRTRESLAATFRSVIGGGAVDEEALEDLEALSEALPYNQGVAKDLADARRAVKHADRGVDGTVAELERHVRARKEAAAREEEAWEARRRAGIKAHRDRAVAAAAATAEAAAAKKETEAKREAEGVAADASSA